ELIGMLVDRLGQLLHNPQEQDVGRDPQLIRALVLESLERSVQRFRQHRCRDLIEAFVTLAGASSETLAAIIDAPHHPCFQTVLQTLSESASPGVLDLLTSYMQRPDAPLVVRNVVSKRSDRRFIETLLAIPVDSGTPDLRKNLARIQRFAWLDPFLNGCGEFEPSCQVGAVRILSASGMPRSDALNLIESLLAQGADAARIAACEALRHINGKRADQLVLSALEDRDGTVQATAASLLRSRPITDAVVRLIGLLDTPHHEVREAIRDVLSEFSFENYVANFDSFDESVRRSTGELVLRIDFQAISKLRLELAGPGRKRKLRAISMVEAMRASASAVDLLVELLRDDDRVVRDAAGDVLQNCSGDDVRAALQIAFEDPTKFEPISSEGSAGDNGAPLASRTAVSQRSETA
ncbi:MAG: hypothetical protein AAF961_06830, partial [Planctomycetota bacterium]